MKSSFDCFSGAYVVQSLATRLQSLLWKSDEEEEDEEEVADDGGVEEGCWGKKAECLILFLAHLYNYRVCGVVHPLSIQSDCVTVLCLYCVGYPLFAGV